MIGPTISRYHGQNAPAGGYPAATAELDQVVQRAAEKLLAMTGRSVEVRFDIDGQSGGAFLKRGDGRTGFGITAKLAAKVARDAKYSNQEQYRALYRAAPRVLEVSVYAGKALLYDPRAFRDYSSPGDSFILVPTQGLDEALGWIRQHTSLASKRPSDQI